MKGPATSVRSSALGSQEALRPHCSWHPQSWEPATGTPTTAATEEPNAPAICVCQQKWQKPKEAWPPLYSCLSNSQVCFFCGLKLQLPRNPGNMQSLSSYLRHLAKHITRELGWSSLSLSVISDMDGGRGNSFIFPKAPGDSLSYTKAGHAHHHVYKKKPCRA